MFVRTLGVSERRACAALGQHRSTQRKVPRGRDDEERLTADIIELARQYGRYGYRKITALLRDAGWLVNDKRVERIWRREGLKVPQKQPKRGRLWLADGSCIRLRPEQPNHVWTYDFVEDRTHDGRKFGMLNVLDEFTHECLAIRVGRKLKAVDVIDVLSDLFILRGVPGAHPLRQRPGVRRQGGAGLDRRGRCQDGLHRAGQPVGERLRRELQRAPARRAAGRRDLLLAAGGPDRDRELAPALQHRPPTWLARLPAAGTGGRSAGFRRVARGATPAGLANHASRGAQANAELTFTADHPMGADQRTNEGVSCTPFERYQPTFTGRPQAAEHPTRRLSHCFAARFRSRVDCHLSHPIPRASICFQKGRGARAP